MTFNPTTNRVPFGLLEDHERIALAKWPHGWQWYSNIHGRWLDMAASDIVHMAAGSVVFRGKPAPREDV